MALALRVARNSRFTFSTFLASCEMQEVRSRNVDLGSPFAPTQAKCTPAPVHVLIVINNEIEFVPSGAELQAEASRAKSAAAADLRNRRIIQPHEQSIVMAQNRTHIAP